MAGSASNVLFAHVANRPDDEIDLAAAALLIAEAEYPGLDVAHYAAVLDGWGEAVRAAAGQDATDERRIEALRAHLFETLGLRGNEDDYYDPRNSFLNEVIDRRVGIPITLSVVYMEVARRAGLDARGIGFPGHFLVRVKASGADLVIDPFHRGAQLGKADLDERLARVSPGAQLSAQHLHLMPKRHILQRMLNNLKAIYTRLGDPVREAAVVERLQILEASDPSRRGSA